MPLDTYQLSKTKDTILAFIRARGPSLPVYIARDIKTSSLFASAFLSELYHEQKLLMSHLQVGSSRLYLLPGQEHQLENFTQYLNQKEQEALKLLRENKILEDESLHPAIRVAIRHIQDFAVPIKIKISNNEKLFWRYAFLPESEIKQLIQNYLSPIQSQQIKSVTQTIEEKPKEKITLPTPIVIPASASAPISESKEIIKPRAKRKPRTVRPKQPLEDSPFIKKLKDYLSAKDIEIISLLEAKSKELTAKIRTNDMFGKQEYYLIAKDRKKVREEDLTHVLHKAQQEKMLALFMAPGDLDVKAQAMLKDYRNLIKFEKLKFGLYSVHKNL